jgi:hypothetical protein
MGKTYIFFEPRDEIFFEQIAKVYTEIIKKYYKDAEKAYSEGESYNFYRNYIQALLFPACDYNSEMQCRHAVCTPDKCPVLTEDQKELVSISLQAVISHLRTARNINNIIIDKIYQKSFFLLSTKTKTLLYRHGNSLPLYLQLMREVSGETDAEKLVYVCSENSSYNYFRDELLKSNQKNLTPCTYY